MDQYCKVHGINLVREAIQAEGKVDILFSYTNSFNVVLSVCMEIKKAQHADVITAVNTQLPEYMSSAATTEGIYLVLWQKHPKYLYPNKYESEDDLLKMIEEVVPPNMNIATSIINCCKPNNPSKIKSR